STDCAAVPAGSREGTAAAPRTDGGAAGGEEGSTIDSRRRASRDPRLAELPGRSSAATAPPAAPRPKLRIEHSMLARARRRLAALRLAARLGAVAPGRIPRSLSFDPLAALRVPLEWLPSRYMAHSLIVVVAII